MLSKDTYDGFEANPANLQWILAGLLTGIAFQKSDKLDGCFPQAEEEDTQQHKLQPISTIPAGLLACGVVTVWRSWIKLVMQTTSTRRYFKFPPLPPAGIPRIMFMWAIVSSSFNTVVGIRYMARILRGQPVVRVASSRPTKTLVETKWGEGKV